MKLKNFIKKKKKVVKPSKNFNLHKKLTKYPNRAEEKTNKKKNRRIILLSVIGVGIFLAALALLLCAYIFNIYIFEKVNSPEIVTPGKVNLINVDSARQILLNEKIQVRELSYSSSSADLVLKTENDTLVYFSNTVGFNDQVKLLKEIFATLKLSEKNARVVDFRYNRPIVKF